MSKFFTCVFSLILILCVPKTLRAAEWNATFDGYNGSNLKVADAIKEIRSHMTQKSLLPFIGDKVTFEITAMINEKMGVSVWGDLDDGENYLGALFSIQKGWFSTETRLLYVSTDEPISAELFHDINTLMITLLPEDPSNYHVLIEKVDQQEELILQLWTYFNQNETLWRLVALQEDGNGGYYFQIMPWKPE